MRYLKVRRSGPIRGDISMPPSKTHSFRALILAALEQYVLVTRPQHSPGAYDILEPRPVLRGPADRHIARLRSI